MYSVSRQLYSKDWQVVWKARRLSFEIRQDPQTKRVVEELRELGHTTSLYMFSVFQTKTDCIFAGLNIASEATVSF